MCAVMMVTFQENSLAGQEWIAPYAAEWPEDAAQQGVESQAEVVEYSTEAASGDHQEGQDAEWPDEREAEQGED